MIVCDLIEFEKGRKCPDSPTHRVKDMVSGVVLRLCDRHYADKERLRLADLDDTGDD